MRVAIAVAVLVLLALSSAHSSADTHDPILVVPDQAVVAGGARTVYVTVAAVDTPAAVRVPHASVIVYAPDGTMLRPRAKLLRSAGTTFRVILSNPPQIGTYTIFGTVEVDDAAFGLPSTFEVAP
jgi:hypothetical protein